MPTRPPGTPTVDLTFDDTFGTINDTVFMTGQFQLVPDHFSSFLEIRNNGTEQGYNTDGALQQNTRDTQNSTHALLLANVPIVVGDGSHGTVEGVAYREFRLTLDEAGSAKQYLSLDALQIWQEESGSLTNFTAGSGFAGAHTNYLAYNLDAGGDHWVGLQEGLNGNGANITEFTVLVPDSDFINDPSHRYVTLYSKFGVQSGWEADSNSEEWGLSVNSAGPTAAMTVHKTATVPGGTANAVGEVISYAVTVANVGDVNLTGITVTDPSVSNLTPTLSAGFNVGDTNHDNQLSTGETWQYTASYTVTQNDLNTNGGGDGFIENTVTADSAQTNPVSATAFVAVESGTSLSLTKTTDVASVHNAGDVINYTIDVTNTGTVQLTSLEVTDTQVNVASPVNGDPILGPPFLAQILVGDYNAGDTNQNGVQDPGETFQYVNAGDTNQNGIQDPGETFLFTNIGDTNQNGGQDTGETFQYYNAGDTNHNGVQDSGETFQFTFDHHATAVDANHDGFNDGDTNHNNILDPGEVWHYTVAYTVTQDDIDNGGVVNPALTHDNTASATTTEGATGSGSVSVSVVQNPHVTLVKSATVADGAADAAGEVINYTINVTNDGNMTLTSPAVSDPSVSNLGPVLSGGFNAGDTDHDGKLDVGETWQYTASHTVTQAEIDNGGVVNAALSYDNTASVTTAQGAADPDANDSASASVPIVQHPAYSIAKTVTDVGGDGPSGHVNAAGDVISYSITVANAGNMTLTGVTLDDTLLTGAHGTLSGPVESLSANGKLDVGETWTYSGTYTAQQADINNNGGGDGDIDNTATVHSAQVADQSSSVATAIDRNPAYSIHKTVTDVGGDGAGGHVNAAGDVISYEIVVNNDGNVDLAGVSVTDALLQGANGTLSVASGDTVNPGTLDVGETWTYTGTYTAQQSDIDGNGGGDGDIDNTATVHSSELADQSSSTATPIDQPSNPSFTLAMAVLGYHDANNNGVADAGDTIDFSLVETNTGNVTLHNIIVSDLDGVIHFSGTVASLGVGASDSTSVTGTHVISSGDVGVGYVEDEAVGNADEPAPTAFSGTVHVALADLHPIGV